MTNKYKVIIKVLSVFVLFIFILGVTNVQYENEKKTSMVNGNIDNFESINNKKIGWGLKRNDNHKQPDLGNTNMSTLDKYEGIYMGNESSNKVYLTFDEGYEARIH